MSVYTRIRNGLEPDGSGNGGATEGDIRGFISDIVDILGVARLDDGDLLVHQAAVLAMTVVVDKGVVCIPNTAYDATDSDSIKFWEAVVTGTTASRTLTIDANSSGSTRIDLITVVLDPGQSPDQYGSNVAVLAVVKGTPGAGAPALPDYSKLLAQVTVLNGATEIANAKITDERVQTKLDAIFLPDNIARTDEDQTISGANTYSGIQTFNSGKLKATRPQVTTSIDDSNGNEVIKTPAAGSAVNEVTIKNSATGQPVELDATGGDTNVDMVVAGKGTGKVKLGQATSTGIELVADQPILDSSDNELIKFVKSASAVNEVTVKDAATGNTVEVDATGDDTNIGLDIKAKGTGVVRKPSALIIQVVEGATSVVTGDGAVYFTIPEELNGMNLVGASAKVIVAGTTGTMDIQIANVTDAVDMLSTKLTVDSTELSSATAAVPVAIDASHDDVATDDTIRIDIDAVQTTKPKGLIIRLRFALP